MPDLKKLLQTTFLLLTFLIGIREGFSQANCGFTLIRDSGCLPLPILAIPTDTSAGIAQRIWYLTNCTTGAAVTTTSPGLNPTFSYVPTVAGNYCLRLWARGAAGDTCASLAYAIVVSDTPIASMTVNPTSFCAPRTVSLNLNCATGCGFVDSTRIQWGCGNITSSPGCPGTVTHNYGTNCNAQCYDINVVLRNTCGCYGTRKFSNAVCVLPQPNANFQVDVTSGVCVASLTSHFTADSVGPNFTYCWLVNGVQQQCNTSRAFTHTFAAAPTCYNITLIVSNGVGCADTLFRDNFICVFNAPQLDFTQDSTSACVDSGATTQVCFDDASFPLIPNPVWYLTGGSPNVTLGPFLGAHACITVTNPGTYSAMLIGNYGGNCVDTLIRPNAFTLKRNPTVCFYAVDTTSCHNPFTTTFYNCTTNAPPGSSYNWNFGYNASPPGSVLQNPTAVTYNGYAKRDVQLTVTGANGCVKVLKKINYIGVDTTTPSFIVDHGFGCAPRFSTIVSTTTVYFGAEPIAHYLWEVFQAGSIVATGQSGALPHTYTNPGCYDIRLTTETASGCVTTAYQDSALCVGVAPTCTMTVSPDTMCFEADSVIFNVQCNWFNRLIAHFGDETNPGDVTYFNTSPVVHTYQSFGDFDAWIIPVSDSCEGDTLFHHILVRAPAANFTSATNCLSGDTVCFTNQALGANRFHWEFNCAPDTFNTRNPCLILPPCDTCRAILTAYNDTTGCKHKKERLISTACNSVNASFSVLPDPWACNFRGFQFDNTTPSASNGATMWDWNLAVPGCNPANGLCSFGISNYHTFSTGYYDIAMVYTAQGGCTDTVHGSITICDLDVDFTPTNVCLPDSFHFVPLITDPVGHGCDSIVYFLWNFGGGDTSNERYPVRLFPFGVRTVTLTVKNKFDCTATITKTIRSSTPVFTHFEVDTNICPGATDICIHNYTTSGSNLTETWYFGGAPRDTNGTVIDSFAGHDPPCLTYLFAGDFFVVHHVEAGNCSKTDSVVMHVHNPVLSGSLTANYTSCPNPPFAVCGINTSQWVDPLTDVYTWNFGNGEYLEINPCDFYTFPGVYPVILIVVTNNGCRDTATIDTVVVDGPYGTISHSPPGICSCKDTIDFHVTTIKSTQLAFVYGCNSGFEIINPIVPVGTALNPTSFDFHVPYCITDSCLPQLTFGDQTGCQVLLNDAYVYVDSPVVDIAFNNYGICLSGTVNFFEATHYTLPPSISHSVDWYWDFGDPFDTATSVQQNPTHYYSQPGLFPVTLKVHSNFGCYDSIISTSVVVIPKFPIAGFYGDDSLICAESSTCFHDTSYIDPNTGPQYWYWDFGDGKTDSTSGPNPCHTYDTGGYFIVHLCIYDSIGCGDCDSGFLVRVISLPNANAGPDTVFCIGAQTQLNGSGSLSCHWDPIGLVSNPNICNPITTITVDTSFVLTVTDGYGCQGRDTLNVLAGSVNASFAVSPTSCLADSVCVVDSSTSVNGVVTTWQYNFGGSAVLNGASVCYQYGAPGNYNIVETVTDNHGCLDTAAHSVTILPQPVAAFSLNDTVICSNEPVCYTDLSTSITTIQSWTWNFGAGQGNFSGANPPCRSYSPVPSTDTIKLEIIDLNGCHDSAMIVLTVNKIPDANFTGPPSCEDKLMQLINNSQQGSPTGAIDSCTWVFWLGAPVPTVSNNCNPFFQFPPGDHDVQLVVHDLNGCVDTIVKSVHTDSLSQLTVYPGDTTLCLGTTVDYHVSGVYDNITWTPTVWISDPYASTVTISPLGNIGYIISAVNGVCDAAGDTFAVHVIQPIPIEVMATPDKIVLGLSSNITSQIPGQIDSIIWTPDQTLDCNNCPNPVAMPQATTTYTATIYYSQDGITCTNSAEVTITVLNNCNESIVYLPNTFTPNNDGINDVFMIRGIAATKINYFRVFDRWGKLVFETQNGAANEPRWGWDGTDMQGQKLNPAVFVYTYEIECINHDVVTGKGNVALVR